MKRTLVAFIGLAFAIYWFSTSDSPSDRPASMIPFHSAAVVPSVPGEHAPDRVNHRMLPWLAVEAAKLKQPNGATAMVVALKRKALTLRPADLASFHAIALDSSVPSDERFLAVYMIGLSEAAAARIYLQDIIETRVPGVPTDAAYGNEVIVRTHALETLVKRINPDAASKILNQIVSNSNDPSLVRRAQYWLGRL